MKGQETCLYLENQSIRMKNTTLLLTFHLLWAKEEIRRNKPHKSLHSTSTLGIMLETFCNSTFWVRNHTYPYCWLFSNSEQLYISLEWPAVRTRKVRCVVDLKLRAFLFLEKLWYFQKHFHVGEVIYLFSNMFIVRLLRLASCKIVFSENK